MTWCDLDDILYDGTKLDMQDVKCPDCGGHIKYTFYNDTFTKECIQCGTIEKNDKSPKPKCVDYYGEEHTF